ncbi:low temperature requirement protein A [Micromonospora endophytica]|uniref:Low temperature requirement protein A n=1 Tax=Micromonospora endophytica TaxID=515350 RepID=A0A2W2CD54_9ACTN|nr:low temperature requirement protein A [Micromonospora endophytica]PZF89778.1 low temperature requirement protein A [Micromonospora endophytica]RIW43237.1 low temperature requirement protein A [Micromonospora endophytica]BCJ61530.1 membrane protein [Micromonospora endophytica]
MARLAGRLTPGVQDPGRATVLELFFDLVFVFALTRISARAFEDLALEPGGATGWSPVTGGAKTLLLLLALWVVWQHTAWTTSRYDPYHAGLQLVVIITLVCAMVMGVAIPRAFTTTGFAFATAYVVAQLSRPLILLAFGTPERRLKCRTVITFTATGVLWIVGAALPTTPRVLLWSGALGVEYVTGRLGYPVPGLGRSVVSQWEIGGRHLAERYQQFFLIALGETILVAGLSYSDAPYPAAQTVAFALALAVSILLWRIYVQRAGQILAEAVASARRPASIGRSAADTHLVMVIGLTATAIGYDLTIQHPLDEPEIAWIVMILGGPVVFLLGRARFEYEVFNRVSPSRWIAALGLALSLPLLLHRSPLSAEILVVGVLGAVALDDARRARKGPPEAAAPPF